MEFTKEQKRQIKKLQKLMLANVIGCKSDIRPDIIKVFKTVKYRSITDEEMKQLELADSISALFDED